MTSPTPPTPPSAVLRLARAIALAVALIVAVTASPREPVQRALAPAPARMVAISVDDLPGVSAGPGDLAFFERVNRDLIAAFARRDVPAIGFVNEGKLASSGATDPARTRLLQLWIDAGLELGNHTYSHGDLHVVPVEDFTRDTLRGEEVTRKLMAAAGKRPRYFRHPFLHTGRDAATRSRLESFLAQHGYTVAPVTIDNYDYMFARAYDRAIAGDGADAERIITTYLDYMTRVVAYYEQQSMALLGREPAQILLLHDNALNARTFDQLAAMFASRGYTFVSLDRALEDPAYQSRDEYYGAGGITWLHRWALTQGKRGTFFAGEPEVPEWIAAAAK